MSQLELDFAVPTPTRTPPPFRREASDPEMWAAVLHEDGFERLSALLAERHPHDLGARVSALRNFEAPHAYAAPREAAAWAGWMNILEHRYTLNLEAA